MVIDGTQPCSECFQIMTSLKPVILIVEDEAVIRVSAAGMLADAGFRTIEAANGDEALKLLDADSDVQLLFTDVRMPGTMDGLSLARRVRDRWPHIGIMVTSSRSMAGYDGLPSGSRFEQKPYSPSTVIRHARELTSV
jgi:two-component system, response regulator PdtaR